MGIDARDPLYAAVRCIVARDIAAALRRRAAMLRNFDPKETLREMERNALLADALDHVASAVREGNSPP